MVSSSRPHARFNPRHTAHTAVAKDECCAVCAADARALWATCAGPDRGTFDQAVPGSDARADAVPAALPMRRRRVHGSGGGVSRLAVRVGHFSH